MCVRDAFANVDFFSYFHAKVLDEESNGSDDVDATVIGSQYVDSVIMVDFSDDTFIGKLDMHK